MLRHQVSDHDSWRDKPRSFDLQKDREKYCGDGPEFKNSCPVRKNRIGYTVRVWKITVEAPRYWEKSKRNEGDDYDDDRRVALDRICHSVILLEDAGDYVVVVGVGDFGAVEGAGDEGFVGAEVVDEDLAVDLGGVECGAALPEKIGLFGFAFD
jgi:hypothetical protein